MNAGAQLISDAESRAVEALRFSILNGFNLVGAKEKLEVLLRQIGMNGIFAEYTRHDISHINTLLSMLDWVIPPSSKETLSPCDWMMLVLAIYFHDAGLVVTRDEFDQRGQTDFPSFKRKRLDESSAAYRERVLRMGNDEGERFLYQEFVRSHHATRIKLWLRGDPSAHLGCASATASAIREIVDGITDDFVSDLATVCESHHLDDLDKPTKYNPRRLYGSTQKERVNIQYAAIILRTVDLLHVTRDRAPSLEFNVINPADPKSIEEWHKQMPVIAVAPAPKRDADNNVIVGVDSDTIAVSANFKDAEGYFALTDYLLYAERELVQSKRWADATLRREKLAYAFPWNAIDTTQIGADGFEKKQFSFELDRPKLLDLLTGHTLYNNSNVVIRELVQNSLDAVRLQSGNTGDIPTISLTLDTKTREMRVTDNGCGMDQQVIEKHFLNVGSSRYKDPTFKRDHPKFSSISRFGIGVLSTFMLADEIEVITRDSGEDIARKLSIRSLHGKYLIRQLEPGAAPEIPDLMRAHGTSVTLRVRAGLDLPDLLAIAKHWILFPGCSITVSVDGVPPTQIGFDSPKSALLTMLADAGLNICESSDSAPTDSAYMVVERTVGDVTVAAAQLWSPLFKEWSLVNADQVGRQKGVNTGVLSAVCVNGIRVDDVAPGFRDARLLAISNCTGTSAPPTNVARSSLEESPESTQMHADALRVYADLISHEIRELCKRGRSETGAAYEGVFLIQPLLSSIPVGGTPREPGSLFVSAFENVPLFLLDEADSRRLVSMHEVNQLPEFWTIESSLYLSAESFIRNTRTGISLNTILRLLPGDPILPGGPILVLSGASSLLDDWISFRCSISEIVVSESIKQTQFRWTRKEEGSNPWMNALGADRSLADKIYNFVARLQGAVGPMAKDIFLQRTAEKMITSESKYDGVVSAGAFYLCNGSTLQEVLLEKYSLVERGKLDIAEYARLLVLAYWTCRVPAGRIDSEVVSRISQQIQQLALQHPDMRVIASGEMRERSWLFAEGVNLFDPYASDRRMGMTDRFNLPVLY